MKVFHYDSGLTVAVERIEGFRSVTSGIMVGTGSAYETPENNGISHFIEHMLFKGTSRRSAQDIVREFDEAGAAYNAFTGKESTCFYFKSIDENLEKCFDILSDLFLNSTFCGDELDRERKVILEEINMSQDEPDGVCYDVLYRQMFKGSLGMEILGSKQNVMRFCKSDIESYRASHYLPSNTVVAFVGNIDPERAAELVEKYMPKFTSFSSGEKRISPEYAVQRFTPGYAQFIHDYEQSEISIAYPALKFGDADALVLSALDCIFGNGMSSRLFQRVREKMGLCYSVYTAPYFGKHVGVFSVCANVNSVNAEECIAAINEETQLLVKNGVTVAETEKAKTQLKVTTLFGKENPMNYMLAMMRRRLFINENYDVDDILSRIEAINADKVNALARTVLSMRPAAAYVGKSTDAALGAVFEK